MNYSITPLVPFGILIQATRKNTSLNQIEMTVLKKYFDQSQLIVIRDFEKIDTAEEFAEYCERWGEISLWPFGKVLELTQHEKPKDHIFDNSYVPLHWDGMYRPEVPEYQIFHCVKAPGSDQGGRTIFSNTVIALGQCDSEIVEHLKKVTVRYTRKMEFYDSTTVSPIITKHPYKELQVIRYNEPPVKGHRKFINPPVIEFLGVGEEELATIQSTLNRLLHSEEACYAHTWHDNDIVIADNFKLLHGREAYTSHANRHLRRVHVNSVPAFKNPGLVEYR